MEVHRLPGRIVKLMIATILVFVLTLGVAVIWMSRTLDAEAREHALAELRIARDSLLAQLRLTALDHARWNAAVQAVEAADLGWLNENMGRVARSGQVAQLVVLWSDDDATSLGWAEGSVQQGRPGLLAAGTVQQVERRLSDLPAGTSDGAEFFAWHEGAVYALGLSWFGPIEEADRAAAEDGSRTRLVMGRRLSGSMIDGIAETNGVEGLSVTRELPPMAIRLP